MVPAKQRNDLYVELTKDEQKQYKEMLREVFGRWKVEKPTIGHMPKIQEFLIEKKMPRLVEMVDEFLDIETVGGCPDYESCERFSPSIANQFDKYFDWFQKRFPEDADKGVEQMFVNRAALVPEFAKIACVSVAFVTEKGETKIQSFSDTDEKKLLIEVQKLLRRIGELGFFLCGHNVKGFDIPMLAKRMIMNGLLPPKILPGHDTKPWEIKALDTKELWQYGGYGSIASLGSGLSSSSISNGGFSSRFMFEIGILVMFETTS